MNPKEFVNTIYLGDRFCKRIIIDGYNDQIKIQINMISRIRNNSGNWKYYNDENIEDGMIVFNGTESIIFDPQGYLPNDEIQFVSVDEIEGNGKFIFRISAASCNKYGEYEDVIITIVAREIFLEDPTNPSKKIIN